MKSNLDISKRIRHKWSPISVVTLTFLMFLILFSCQKDENDLFNQDYLSSLSQEALSTSSGILYYGHKTFTRSTGVPVVETQNIENPYFNDFDGNFVLKVQNGRDKKTRVSSAEIRIDGVLVVGYSDFSKNISFITKQLSGLGSESVLEIKLFGEPGSFIDLWIEGTLKSEYYLVEQAFPDVKGELVDFIVNGEVITCQKINGEYIFQGDIILTEDQIKYFDSQKGAGGIWYHHRWPNGIVYYNIDPNLPSPERVTEAIKDVEEQTYIKFIQRTDELNYVVFLWEDDRMDSNYGMAILPGPQKIRISNDAKKGNVIHEIGHTLGLIHEHSRWDRNEFIVVLKENIIPDYKYNFDRISTFWESDEFDFNSIMLYGSYAFSINGLPTITKLDGTTFERNRVALSPIDIEVINSMYDEYSLIFHEGFEIYANGTFPSTWVKDGNATDNTTNYVTNLTRSEGNKSLKLFGTIGGCWASIAYHGLGIAPSFIIEADIKNGNESLFGCHPERAGIFLREGVSWLNPFRELVLFDGDGYIYLAGEKSDYYNNNIWYKLRVKYEKTSSTQVKLSFWINNEFKSVITSPAIPNEDFLTNLELTVQEGSAWFDNISVLKY